MYVIDNETYHKDESLNFLYKDTPESSKICHYMPEQDFPYIGCKIVDIEIERFSEEFETNASTGETRPDGGDYFKEIIMKCTSYICNNLSSISCSSH